MRLVIAATLLGAGMLVVAAPSHAQSISIGRSGNHIAPSQGCVPYQYYQPYQSYYSTPYQYQYQYQYSQPYYSNYGYQSNSHWNNGWNHHGGH